MRNIGYKNTTFETEIDISLPNGDYQFVLDSSTGKTYLANKLKEYRRLGKPVTAVSYVDFTENTMKLLDREYNVVLIDRYDLYSGKLDNIIAELGARTTVLVDFKLGLKIPRVKVNYCIIKFNLYKIEVK